MGLLVALARFAPTVIEIDRAGRYGAGTAPAVAASALALVFAVVAVWRLLPLLPDELRPVFGVAGGIAALGAVTALLANAGYAVAGAEGMRWATAQPPCCGSRRGPSSCCSGASRAGRWPLSRAWR
ncbi:hypothetical protein [Tsukamurella sp. PLM1]|uniref:hypothetical protein n=1 Tax=Tsukamurella sp. PLM1 TaxID=2929795 RepID=UPI00204932B9|nr:hypothetical protein [Tsukamurella sp. PLM1]BDH58900.1 hypothetical protein MTP03_38390 [Tsukamurella sp. PLM1]